MPLYEFQCKKCANVEEFLLKYGELPDEPCPKCGGKWEKIWSTNAPVQADSGSGSVCEYGGCTPDSPG